jgi:hypothetical protein
MPSGDDAFTIAPQLASFSQECSTVNCFDLRSQDDRRSTIDDLPPFTGDICSLAGTYAAGRLRDDCGNCHTDAGAGAGADQAG